MKRIATALVSLFIFLSYATAQNPVSWTFSLEDNGNGEISLIAKATIEAVSYTHLDVYKRQT